TPPPRTSEGLAARRRLRDRPAAPRCRGRRPPAWPPPPCRDRPRRRDGLERGTASRGDRCRRRDRARSRPRRCDARAARRTATGQARRSSPRPAQRAMLKKRPDAAPLLLLAPAPVLWPLPLALLLLLLLLPPPARTRGAAGGNSRTPGPKMSNPSGAAS